MMMMLGPGDEGTRSQIQHKQRRSFADVKRGGPREISCQGRRERHSALGKRLMHAPPSPSAASPRIRLARLRPMRGRAAIVPPLTVRIRKLALNRCSSAWLGTWPINFRRASLGRQARQHMTATIHCQLTYFAIHEQEERAEQESMLFSQA